MGEDHDLFVKCMACNEPVYRATLDAQLWVCHLCGHHFRMGVVDRLRSRKLEQ